MALKEVNDLKKLNLIKTLKSKPTLVIQNLLVMNYGSPENVNQVLKTRIEVFTFQIFVVLKGSISTFRPVNITFNSEPNGNFWWAQELFGKTKIVSSKAFIVLLCLRAHSSLNVYLWAFVTISSCWKNCPCAKIFCFLLL